MWHSQNDGSSKSSSASNSRRRRHFKFEEVEARLMLSANSLGGLPMEQPTAGPSVAQIGQAFNPVTAATPPVSPFSPDGPIAASPGPGFPGAQPISTTGSGYSTIDPPISILPTTPVQLPLAFAPTGTTTLLDSSGVDSTGGELISLTATVFQQNPYATDTPATTATGTVTFMDGSTVLGTEPLQDGTATLFTSSLAAGNHSITAVYSGQSQNQDPDGVVEGGFGGSTSSAVTQVVTATATATTVTSSSSSSIADEPVTLTATLAGTSGQFAYNSTGAVTFMDGSTVLGTATVANGVATLTTSSLPAGNQSITAVYSGDSDYLASTSAAITDSVLPAATTATTTVLDSSAVSSVGGEQVTFTATLLQGNSSPNPSNNPIAASNATGTVTFMDGSTVLGTVQVQNAAASFTTSSLAAGDHPITAVYSGDANFQESTSNEVTQSVAAAATTTTLTSSASSLTAGSFITLTATIGYQNSVYGGPSSGTDNLGVAVPDILMTIIPAGSTAQGATGTVTFMDGSTALGTAGVYDGVATLDSWTLPVGNQSITAVYSGDSEFQGSNSTAITEAVQANPFAGLFSAPPSGPVMSPPIIAPPEPTATVLDSSAVSSTGGESVTFTATVFGSFDLFPGAGTVTFMDGSTVLGTAQVQGGAATFTTSSLAAGDHSITAVYSGVGDGMDQYAGSTSNTVDQEVTATATTTTLASSASSSTAGSAVTLTATVGFQNAVQWGPSSGTDNLGLPQSQGMQTVTPAGSTAQGATGTVTFMDGSTILGTANVTNGVATLTTSSLPVGSQSITAVYSGDSDFQASTSPAITQSVAAATPTAPVLTTTIFGTGTTELTSSASSSTAGQPVTLTATIEQSYFPPEPSWDAGQSVLVTDDAATGTVTFMDGSTVLGTANVTNGVATLTTSSLPVGSQSITAVYSGDSDLPGNASPAITQSVAAAAPTTPAPTSPAPTCPAHQWSTPSGAMPFPGFFMTPPSPTAGSQSTTGGFSGFNGSVSQAINQSAETTATTNPGSALGSTNGPGTWNHSHGNHHALAAVDQALSDFDPADLYWPMDN